MVAMTRNFFLALVSLTAALGPIGLIVAIAKVLA